MRAVLQRVTSASVEVDKTIIGSINDGYMILLGIEETDNIEDIKWLSNKIINLRVFADKSGKMNHNIKDIKGNILLISQFTLHASYKKGNRPSFTKAANPKEAILIYEKVISQLTMNLGKEIETGKFGADMQVSITNYGPVTIILDSKNKE